ncbi:MAG: nucleoside phosphorylase [Crocinitomicaceae bacterium]|nr:nucleoside phosphorylase [Crocinitomicaceae bacterium]
MTESLAPSELIINPDGSIYHLHLKPGDLAKKIIIVGDQDRVKKIGDFLDEVTFTVQNREFATITGLYKNKAVSIVSTGIGTDNIDIVVQEIDAVFNIDFTTRKPKENLTQIDFVRIGTCGILEDEIPVGSFLLSTAAVGLDNVGHFYEIHENKSITNILTALTNELPLPNKIVPYMAEASKDLNQRLKNADVYEGITVTSSGFYGPQGRALRLQIKTNELIEALHDFEFEGQGLQNLEMECSALFALSQALGHQSTAICLGLANRRLGTFAENYSNRMETLILHVLKNI